MNYALKFPSKIIFAPGALVQIKDIIPAEASVLLLFSKSGAKTALAYIPEWEKYFSALFQVNISGEPQLDSLQELIDFARSKKVTHVISIGGGSVMDSGKTVAIMATQSSAELSEYFYNRKTISHCGLFHIAVPTTAGTGAEITSNAVLTDHVTLIKQSLRSDLMYPNVALVDPQLTYDCTLKVTAASGLDSLTQAIESYLSLKSNTFSKSLAQSATFLAFKALNKLSDDLTDHAARNSLAEATMLGAMAFSSSGLGAVHGLAHPIGSLLKIPHGLCCGILLPLILKWNYPECREALDTLAQSCKYADGAAFIEQIELLKQKFAMPVHLRSFGLKKEHFGFIIENCRSGSMKSNPRYLDDQEIIKILEELL